jgi:hypothetical protein
MGPLARLLQGHFHRLVSAKGAFPPGRRITYKATSRAPADRRVRPGGNNPLNLPADRARTPAAGSVTVVLTSVVLWCPVRQSDLVSERAVIEAAWSGVSSSGSVTISVTRGPIARH